MAASAVAASGLAFALTLLDGGRSVSASRFALRTPGMPGAVVLSLEDPDLYGNTFASPVRVKNETGGDLLAVSVEVEKVTETRRLPGGGDEPHEHAGGEGQPPAWDRIPKDGESSALLLRAGPVAFGEATAFVILLGRVHGVAALGSFMLEEARSPAELRFDPPKTLWVRDANGTVVRTDGEGTYPVAQKAMPPSREKPSSACAALGDRVRICREAADGTLATADEKAVTVRDTDGRSRAFSPGGDGAPTALAWGRDGRLYVATAGAEGRPGSVRAFRPF